MRREKDSSPSFNSSYHVEDTDDFAAFELLERICSVVRGLRDEHFRGNEKYGEELIKAFEDAGVRISWSTMVVMKPKSIT
jgi:hypothetical protein